MDKFSPSLTLVIPAYNRGKLIAETIQSALNQTEAFDQIIVVDDGSTDDTMDVLRQFGNRLQIISSENQGVQNARNLGVASATSEYVTLCDSDDLLEENFVESIKGWLNKEKDCDVIYCNFRNFNDEQIYPDKFSQAPSDYFQGAISSGNFLAQIPDLYARTIDFQPLFPTAMTIRKSFYQELGGYNTTFNRVGSEDWEFTLRAISAGNVALMSIPLSRIRRHAGNDSASALHMILGEIKILEFAQKSHALAKRYDQQIRIGLENRRINAFNLSFGQGDLILARRFLAELGGVSFNLKLTLKKLVLALPEVVRLRAWKLLQR